jgi:hypothetical protein
MHKKPTGKSPGKKKSMSNDCAMFPDGLTTQIPVTIKTAAIKKTQAAIAT